MASEQNQRSNLPTPYQAAADQGHQRVNPAREQTAIDWRADGTARVTVVDANTNAKIRPTPRRETIRADARRQAEYLASRGKTPIEALHDLVKLGWKRGVRELVTELQIKPAEAAVIFERWATTLMPYTAARFDVMELGAGMGAGLGGSMAAHFLAARAMSDLLAGERDAGAGSPRGTSPVQHTVDATEIRDLGLHDGGVTGGIPAGLPPKGTD